MTTTSPSSMVLVTCDLRGCGVFLANERLTCSITFSNQGSSPATLAWAGAQIHCQACVREDIIQFDLSRVSIRSPTSTETAFVPNKGEKGYTICSTPTTVLFCSLVLNPGEVKNVLYSEQLPPGPPSFGGRLIKYSYKLTVGAQKLGCPTQMIRVPFRVLVIPEALYLPYVTPSPRDINPFLVSEVKEDPTLELALQVLATETSRRTSREDVTGTVDLTTATIACLQISVVLQCIEEVCKESKKPSATLTSVCTTHARHLECCHNTLQSQFSLPIPLSVSQSFETSAVIVRWQLHFEFLLAQGSADELLNHASPSVGFSGSKSATMWKGVVPVAMDTMTWDLPIKILPTSPDQAEPISQPRQHVIQL